MRTAFVKSILNLARQDDKVFLLAGDLGYGVLEEFRDTFPKRFLNVGVAEANMATVAAGLALCGKKPYIYSIATFAVLRCLEQIRIDICYQDLDVTIVGVGAGLSYSVYGASHQSIDDVGIMRSVPNLVVASAGDPAETELLMQHSLQYNRPYYLRLGTKGEPVLHPSRPTFQLGRGAVLMEGIDMTVIATGNMLENAHRAATQLKNEGVNVRLISMPYVKPIDRELIRAAARETGILVSVEEHCLTGGLGAAIVEVLVEEELGPIQFKRIALPDAFPPEVGGRAYLRDIYKLSVEGIADALKKVWAARQSLGARS